MTVWVWQGMTGYVAIKTWGNTGLKKKLEFLIDETS